MLEKLKKIQEQKGLTNAQMATLLGYVNPTTWVRIKNGTAPANHVFELRAREAFPELRGYAGRRPRGVKK